MVGNYAGKVLEFVIVKDFWEKGDKKCYAFEDKESNRWLAIHEHRGIWPVSSDRVTRISTQIVSDADARITELEQSLAESDRLAKEWEEIARAKIKESCDKHTFKVMDELKITELALKFSCDKTDCPMEYDLLSDFECRVNRCPEVEDEMCDKAPSDCWIKYYKAQAAKELGL